MCTKKEQAEVTSYFKRPSESILPKEVQTV